MTVEEAMHICAGSLDQLKTLFTPGCKFTLVVRTAAEFDADILLTDDDYDAVIAAVERLRDSGNEQRLRRDG